MKRRAEVAVHFSIASRGKYKYGYGAGGMMVMDHLFYLVMGLGDSDLQYRCKAADRVFHENHQ